MKVEARELEGRGLTGREMYAMVERYWSDVAPYLGWSFGDWFDYVRRIPYVADSDRFKSRVIELVPRPLFLLDRAVFPKIDCKKKAILIGAWARGRGLPYRFVAVSSRLDKVVHHVFPQVDFGQGWVNADATFPGFSIGQGQPTVTYAAELER